MYIRNLVFSLEEFIQLNDINLDIAKVFKVYFRLFKLNINKCYKIHRCVLHHIFRVRKKMLIFFSQDSTSQRRGGTTGDDKVCLFLLPS